MGFNLCKQKQFCLNGIAVVYPDTENERVKCIKCCYERPVSAGNKLYNLMSGKHYVYEFFLVKIQSLKLKQKPNPQITTNLQKTAIIRTLNINYLFFYKDFSSLTTNFRSYDLIIKGICAKGKSLLFLYLELYFYNYIFCIL